MNNNMYLIPKSFHCSYCGESYRIIDILLYFSVFEDMICSGCYKIIYKKDIAKKLAIIKDIEI